jgi:CHAT domain-containing protein/tetratricopeptide (TPR) repeat protein
MMDRDASVTAQQALDTVQRCPQEAVALGQRAIVGARRAGDVDSQATAERAIGLALRELHDFDAALRHLRRGVRLADRAGSATVAALGRMSLGYVLASAGHNLAALRAVTAALGELTGLDAGRARMQRGVVEHYRGRYDRAARDYTAAIEIAQHESDELLEARARNNRGLLAAYLGAGGNVDDDFDRAAVIFSKLGLDLAAADVRWNTGIAAAQRGHLPLALRVFAETDAEYRRLAVPRPALLLDRLELVLSVPLVDEAARIAAAAVRELRQRGLASDLAEALLAQARVALLRGDPQTAQTIAGQARARLRRQGRRAWAAFARHVELRAQLQHGVRSAALLSAMTHTAAELDQVGWRAPALTIRIEAAQLARELGRPAQAHELLTVAARARRGGTASLRVRGWYAQALARRLSGEDTAAATALRRGLAELDTYRAALGATELRAVSATPGQELAREGLDIALASGRAHQVLAWAERWRAGALRLTPVLPPQDPALAAALTGLRTISAELEQTLLAGNAVDSLARRQVHLEHQVLQLSRRVDGRASVANRISVPILAARLGVTVLVELVSHHDRLLAVVVRDGRATLHELGAVSAAQHQLRLLLFGLRRLVTLTGSTSARAATEHAAARLDAQLFDPLRERVADRPLVLVPTGALNAMPWSALPTCARRAVTVAPSAAVWLRACDRPRATGDAVLVAGPRLPAAQTECTSLAAILPGARVLLGEEASAGRVAAALDGAALAHVAAHGTFRADNPLFSTIELADGPLTAYELERLATPPGCVVLSTCDSGRSTVDAGDELLGFTAVLLGLGTRTLIASVLPVPAEATIALMLELHRQMVAGTGPAEALAAARRASIAGGAGDDLAYATAAAFSCIGAA